MAFIYLFHVVTINTYHHLMDTDDVYTLNF